MKLKKKSGLIGAVIALSCASLVSVGFASWVISQSDTANVSGTISVDTITDNRYIFDDEETKLVTELSSSTAVASNVVVYGSNAINASGWLKNDAANENLTFYLKVKVSNAASKNIADVISSVAVTSTGGGTVYVKNGHIWDASHNLYTSSTEGASAKTGFEGAKEEVYLSSKSLVADPTITPSGSTFNANGECWYTVQFNWGTFTGGANPNTYFNALDVNDEGENASESLKALNTLLDGANYTITITSVAA